ncbi:phenylalanine--tRNA ligase subunit beta [Paenibacillus pasadenensis]|uniref:phenylalanine--tRNA ligase subunit beta n=1 Tax=Paenibacillus pasadenensis TaxID=217090 RepID=UPI00203DBDD0|nr:phenylalanine--tRNA ligase subunit beta [Paenibacillus pasadenensis]MCM3746804.1 phenylalanine--tRNA ligase subunit beta [Paenibacillus pasadenensis]
MKISTSWLADYISLEGLTPEEIAEKMTSGGIEIDSVEAVDKGVTGVVVGYVKEKTKHPDADKLNVCKIDVGTGEELQIVCGAANVDAGQYVPVATIGAKLPGDFAIKRAKLRGVESQGMICSALELGLNDKLLPKELQEGILVLPKLPLGKPIGEVLDLNTSVLELDLTPNRSDALSYIGVAYELAALTGHSVKLPDGKVFHAAEKTSDHLSVRIEAREECPHYSARFIKHVQVAPSPLWLQNRLMAAGIRPINNIVDVTNYVMLEYGQPLHAFDADRVADGGIIVRMAREGEELETLDGQQRKLQPHMLVIADSEKAIGLAGVMGGANSEVTADTVNIILESAKFDGSVVRRTSRQLGLRSEASLRFEKEVDPARVIPALDRAAALIAELGQGLVTEGIAQELIHAAQPAVIEVSLERIGRYLGIELSKLEVQTIFGRLGFDSEIRDGGLIKVQVPTRRSDITRDVDLIEEVARLYGYDNIPTTPIVGETTPGALTVPQAVRRELRRRLSDAGLNEVISYSFTAPARTKLFPELSQGAVPIRLAMPMSEERSVLRTSLLPQLLETAAYNRNRKNNDLALFEIGTVFHTDEAELTRLPQEKHRFAVLLTGLRRSAAWNRKAEKVDFYDAKGVLETVFDVLGLTGSVSYEAAAPGDLHPGRTAAVKLAGERGEQIVGYVGQLHPELQQESGLDDVYVAELDLAALYDAVDRDIVYRQLPRYPASDRDIAVTVDEAVPAAALAAAVQAAAGELLESVQVFDVYTGEKLGAGRKSVALALVYRHPERTLTDEEVTSAHAAAVAALEQSFSAELRK